MSNNLDLHTVLLSVAAATTVAVGGFLYSKSKTPNSMTVDHVDYNQMSLALDAEGLTRTSVLEKRTMVGNKDYGKIETLYDIFNSGMEKGADSRCLAYKNNVKDAEYKWYTYSEVDRISEQLGAGIIGRLSVSGGQKTKLGIFMRNSPQWVFTEQACNRFSMIPVPLYETLGEEACVFIVNHTQIEVIFVDTRKKLDFLMKRKEDMPTLRNVVMTSQNENKQQLQEAVGSAIQHGVEVVGIKEVLDYGKAHPLPLQLPSREDICTICFTSGTTGIPKGCVVTHWSMVNSVSSAFIYTDIAGFGIDTEVHFSFLPLTHLYERLAHLIMFLFTSEIYFFCGDITTLIDEMKQVRPTIMFSVPRLLNRIYDKIMLGVSNSSRLSQFIFHTALSSKAAEINRRVIRHDSVWDWLVLGRIRAALGGRIKILMVTSAPVASQVLQLFRAGLGCMVVEGYGQTETSGPCTMTLPGDIDEGQVGVPVPGVTVKLADVVELEIVAARDRRGEICVKGDLGITEYYNSPAMTNQLIDSEGWLHTGDVGCWTEKGQLRIVDRCKHMFKLAQGEYLAPERLENVYSLSPLVAQIFVTGNSLEDYCVAIVVPDPDGWPHHLSGDPGLTNERRVCTICAARESGSMVLKELAAVGRANGLVGFEIVKKVLMWSELMTPENGLLTPTLKLKRAVASRHFSRQVDQLYGKKV